MEHQRSHYQYKGQVAHIIRKTPKYIAVHCPPVFTAVKHINQPLPLHFGQLHAVQAFQTFLQ
jgi:hypothetical protein